MWTLLVEEFCIFIHPNFRYSAIVLYVEYMRSEATVEWGEKEKRTSYTADKISYARVGEGGWNVPNIWKVVSKRFLKLHTKLSVYTANIEVVRYRPQLDRSFFHLASTWVLFAEVRLISNTANSEDPTENGRKLATEALPNSTELIYSLYKRTKAPTRISIGCYRASRTLDKSSRWLKTSVPAFTDLSEPEVIFGTDQYAIHHTETPKTHVYFEGMHLVKIKSLYMNQN